MAAISFHKKPANAAEIAQNVDYVNSFNGKGQKWSLGFDSSKSEMVMFEAADPRATEYTQSLTRELEPSQVANTLYGKLSHGHSVHADKFAGFIRNMGARNATSNAEMIVHAIRQKEAVAPAFAKVDTIKGQIENVKNEMKLLQTHLNNESTPADQDKIKATYGWSFIQKHHVKGELANLEKDIARLSQELTAAQKALPAPKGLKEENHEVVRLREAISRVNSRIKLLTALSNGTAKAIQKEEAQTSFGWSQINQGNVLAELKIAEQDLAKLSKELIAAQKGITLAAVDKKRDDFDDVSSDDEDEGKRAAPVQAPVASRAEAFVALPDQFDDIDSDEEESGVKMPSVLDLAKKTYELSKKRADALTAEVDRRMLQLDDSLLPQRDGGLLSRLAAPITYVQIRYRIAKEVQDELARGELDFEYREDGSLVLEPTRGTRPAYTLPLAGSASASVSLSAPSRPLTPAFADRPLVWHSSSASGSGASYLEPRPSAAAAADADYNRITMEDAPVDPTLAGLFDGSLQIGDEFKE